MPELTVIQHQNRTVFKTTTLAEMRFRSLAPGASFAISITFAPASTGTFTGSRELIDEWAGRP
jgi:hypothetical protein